MVMLARVGPNLGPENDMVDEAIRQGLAPMFYDGDYHSVAVFKELDFGCRPVDILIAYLDDSERVPAHDLKNNDWRYMGSCSFGTEQHWTGRRKRDSVRRLTKAGYLKDGRPSTQHGVLHMVAIEAKMSGVKKVIEQAHINLTIANKSYVLMPGITPRTQQQTSRWGLGTISMRGGLEVRSDCSATDRPRGYYEWAVWTDLCSR